MNSKQIHVKALSDLWKSHESGFLSFPCALRKFWQNCSLQSTTSLDFSALTFLGSSLSSYTMSTQTETAAAPELTSITRVASIPLVASSLTTIHTTLTNNSFTRTPYSAAQGISQTALSYAEPIQKRLAPILVCADNIVNAGLDAVESRYPYPFKTSPEDLVRDIRGRSDHAYGVANKTLDERVRAPALSVAQGIDQVCPQNSFTLPPSLPSVHVVRYQVADISPVNASVLRRS